MSDTARTVKFRPLTTWSNFAERSLLIASPFLIEPSMRPVEGDAKGDTRPSAIVLPLPPTLPWVEPEWSLG
jgi:hypothetical protein